MRSSTLSVYRTHSESVQDTHSECTEHRLTQRQSSVNKYSMYRMDNPDIVYKKYSLIYRF